MNEIKKVIDNDYCIGCGACAITNHTISIKRNQYGLKTANYNDSTKFSSKDNSVCPFSTSSDEDALGKQFFSQTSKIQYDRKIGYYLSLYAGNITNNQMRMNTSSGGILSWLASYLLENNLVDGIIHVKSTDSSPDLFKYTLSTSSQEILNRGKSRYYHVSFEDIKDLLNDPKLVGRYVFVGVPCYIKAMRLLSEEIPRLKSQIIYYFALFCGHMKTSAFAELLSWQQGIHPNDLKSIDFRVKNLTGLSSRYSVSAESKRGKKVKDKSYRLYGSDWGLGFFKPKACDWCDDVSGELADITFGDAWLPEYTDDSLGTNILIVRNALLDTILREQSGFNLLNVTEISKDKIIASQAGNYRHRHEGLSIRIEVADEQKIWHPKKRIRKADYEVSTSRKGLYLVREEIAQKSHKYFLEAKEKSNLTIFAIKMLPLELKYHYYNKRLVKGTVKTILNLLTMNFKREKQ